MKKLYLYLLLIFFTVLPAVAHDHGHGPLTPEKHKEFREYKMKYLAQEMGLKDDTRNKFFEVYNQLSDERHAIRSQMHTLHHKIKDKTATEEDYSTMNRLRDQDNEIEKKYDAKFSTFLSGKEIFKMKEAENTFRKKLHEMKAKKEKKK